MKELERTSKISVSAVIIIMVILIGFLTFQKPANVFQTEVEDTLSAVRLDGFSSTKVATLNSESSLIIDVRSAFEYEQGHFLNAVNIPMAHLLNDDSKAVFKKNKENGLAINFYGSSPREASNAALFLNSLGYENIKVIDAIYDREADKFISNNSLETPVLDYAAYMKKAAEGKVVIKKAKKKVLKIKKKKKKGAEGGC